MAAIACEDCSDGYKQNLLGEHYDSSSNLALVLSGKVLLNLVALGVNRQYLTQSFMGFFCICLAVFDFTLLLSSSAISLFEGVVALGIWLTKYHICLVTQIMSLVYSILHWPVFITAGLDYYFHMPLVPATIARKLFYIFIAILLWTLSVLYVFNIADVSFEWMNDSSFPSYRCHVFSSSQCRLLSAVILLVMLFAMSYCWSGLFSLLRSTKRVSYLNETALFFQNVEGHTTYSYKKLLLTSITACFLSTWIPYVLFQMIVLVLEAQVPAYLDMNVPWLCFINSFLLGAVHWLSHQEVLHNNDAVFPDGFCCWKFCHATLHYVDKTHKLASEPNKLFVTTKDCDGKKMSTILAY
ncbi:probable G-protein coupled receptor 160 [Latimeria chalumnae]|uniref:G protein-coupled receptor 160 n=1 Tax=Latimeria chalumnae TaxID=7897 RepID=M3XGR6_LATCH|nr:PREDICTED: probable G-protein coupled receptor 160 [Latimeria chalumnae]|eukprot:XP_005992813.1 PREDICTED: probable G-protein coupled receptor 160 [Latimeria chalumnae]